jgi:hypothetical protein
MIAFFNAVLINTYRISPDGYGTRFSSLSTRRLIVGGAESSKASSKIRSNLVLKTIDYDRLYGWLLAPDVREGHEFPGLIERNDPQGTYKWS